MTLSTSDIARAFDVPVQVVVMEHSEFVALLGDELTEASSDDGDGIKAHGDPALGSDGIHVPVDADCPACGWPERVFDTMTRRFACPRCDYTSDERNA